MAIQTLGVIGAGQMGSGIAQVAAASGLTVVMNDIKPEFVLPGQRVPAVDLSPSSDPRAKLMTPGLI